MEGGDVASEEEKKKPPEGETKVKRKMKTAAQLEILEKTYAVETYPSETLRAELSAKLGLSDRQLQMWFCHRRLKDRKTPPVKRPRKDASSPAAAVASSSGAAGDEMIVGEVGNEHGSGSGSGLSPFAHVESQHQQRVFPRVGHAVARIGADMPAMKRYYEPPQAISELRAIDFVEAQLGEPLREDGPILGMEFDPLPPGAFGAPIVTVGQQKPAVRSYEPNLYERSDGKPIKGVRALHEYQFLPEQPSVRSDTYERAAPSHYFGSSTDVPTARSALSTGHSFMHGNEQVPSGYGFQSQMPNLSLLPQQSRQGHLMPSTSGEYEIVPRKNTFASVGDAHFGSHPITGLDNPFVSPERRVIQDEDIPRIERKRKSEEARIAREVEAHEKRIRKELAKQDILRRKREEQMRKEMERQDRERRKEEERLLREKQREEERYQREQRREMERREKFLQKESIRAEKMRLKEEMRREKEAARLKAANDRATARRMAKESMELIEDERLELMELAASNRGLSSILSLDGETLQNLELLKDKLVEFPPKSLHMKRPFAIQPWTDCEENIGNLFMVWRFLTTFADVLGLWPFTLDEFVQAFHDYDPRLLGEIHVALLRSIIKDIEDVARTPSTGLAANQNSAVNPGGGHPQIVEGAYAWGFDIRSWQRHLNPLTWPEVLRQFALSAGLGPKLKKRSVEQTYLRDDNEGNDGEDIISNLRSGIAAENAVAIMQERGFSNPRRSRHRLTPGTVKFAAFHVLSLEGSKGLTILEVADKIQKSGLRDLTTSKTPEASIAAALSRDTKLFERTAPSTYCVRAPYRKDPADAEAILTAAREKIQIFKNGYLNGEEDAEDVERDDVERDEDSESDVAEDPEADDLDNELKPKNEALSCEANIVLAKTSPGDRKETCDEVIESSQDGLKDSEDHVTLMHQAEGFKEERGTGAKADQSIDVVGICNEVANGDQDDAVIDESNSGESWVQGLMEGEYSDLSVEERLNALVALIGVANEGNSIRVVLEERLEAAYALKKQMWAEAQLDKRRMKEEYVMKVPYPSFVSNKAEPGIQNYASEGRQSLFPSTDEKNGLASTNPVVQREDINDLQNDSNYATSVPSERNSIMQDFATGTDNLPLQHPGYAAERSRSQLKAYIGHKAEEMYVYRSLPLGQDRRRNRYWQFITSASRNDPGSGRIFVELCDGCWRVIDSEEGFDNLLASLDVRGVRESHLYSMLQKIEVSFRETCRRNLERTSPGGQTGSNIKIEISKMDSAGSSSTDSPSSTICASNADMPEPSSSFAIGLGRNETEKKDALNRYLDFEKWMWEECLNSSVLCAVKYGKKRCKQLLGICDDCHDSYLFEDNHCPHCHRTYNTPVSDLYFLEHVAQCKSKLKVEPGLMLHDLDSCPPLRIRLLKALVTLMEVSVPVEALQPIWSEDYRKSWGVKLHATSSAEGFLQILTLYEAVVKRDFLSSDFEKTSELLGLSGQTESSDCISPNCETVCVLPWVPHTSSAVALRLMELDASISYTLQQKIDSQKDKGAVNITPLPAKFAAMKNISANGRAGSPYEAEHTQDPWIDSGSGHGNLARGRGVRGRGRGRTRGGRSQRRAATSRSEAAKRSKTKGERLGQLLGWKGRSSRGRGGYKRGRRTARSRPKPVKSVIEITTQQDQPEDNIFKNSMTNSCPAWDGEENAENMSSSERSEYEDYDNGQGMGDEEYDDLAVNDYSGAFDDKSEHLMEGVDYSVDPEEDDNDNDNDCAEDGDDVEDDEEDDSDEGGDTDVERYINGESDDEGNRDEGEQIGDPDGGTGSTSDYSD